MLCFAADRHPPAPTERDRAGARLFRSDTVPALCSGVVSLTQVVSTLGLVRGGKFGESWIQAGPHLADPVLNPLSIFRFAPPGMRDIGSCGSFAESADSRIVLWKRRYIFLREGLPSFVSPSTARKGGFLC